MRFKINHGYYIKIINESLLPKSFCPCDILTNLREFLVISKFVIASYILKSVLLLPKELNVKLNSCCLYLFNFLFINKSAITVALIYLLMGRNFHHLSLSKFTEWYLMIFSVIIYNSAREILALVQVTNKICFITMTSIICK